MQSIKFYKVNLDKFEEIMIFKHQQNHKQHKKEQLYQMDSSTKNSSTKWTTQPKTAQPKRTAQPEC